jgi:uncharacterized protein (TIGR03067 family)
MSIPMLLALAALILLASCLSGNAAQQNEDPLQGTWSLVSLEVNGEALPVEKIKDSRLSIQGDVYTFRLGEMRLALTYQADLSKEPKTLDMTVTEGPMKGKTYHAIFTFENGNLKICRNLEPDRERPTRFGSRPDSGLMVIVWKRVAP